ncbi:MULTISPECIES: LytR/AlgR family response regulator transcription factor [Tenacibaculum]|uniref:LytR/AlgR family response regulator transcription factor n=1 Tax=Tenacibaculum TaxID=104267 RepID=UPI001F0A740D|nr:MULTISPECIES: LytTR family DNA-binding domain-containing protein [Tenacibaculum]MCH3881270.1 LytTR family DNA-binding domain-containing protein [Tenacibaculum aquimarinum]MCH3883872.1 LytTR family DNA-binding domain-containing protein [Tenacibaculum aquimarinum]MDO6599136.1 LytTR family DNA-binding domain-containing protein [Tenacibaculum sp. 1_MG-2023]
MINAVIVDDELKAIKSLSWEISNFEDIINVVATFDNPEEALFYLKNNKIDCLFLDIEMPTMDGFQFLERIEKRDFAVVITTAYNDYAIKALKNEAIDYLLKPIDTDDLKDTLEKVKKYNYHFDNTEKFEKILTGFNEKFNQRKITVSTDGKLIFLESDEILFVESEGNYSTIHTKDGKKIVLTKKLKEVDQLLPSNHFFRIHNSFIINLNKIKEFLKTDGYVIIEGNHKIPVSRQKKSEFLEKF